MSQNISSNKIYTPCQDVPLNQKDWDRIKINEIPDNIRIAPLSFSQQQIWIIEQMQPGNYAYNLPVCFLLKGKLNVEILENSFNEIINRHETLRTTFGLIKDQPKQLVHPEFFIKIKRINLENLSSEELENQLNKLIHEEVTRPFDLLTLPLIRVALIKLSDDENILVLNLHHIISDGWSMGLVFRELSELYNNYLNGTNIKLPELPVQYSDYAKWQLQKNWEPSYDEQLNFWAKQLDGELPILELPFNKPRPGIQALSGSNEFFFLSKDLTQKIQSIGIKKGCTFFMTMLASFQVFLSKYSGMTDIIIGTPISNRPRETDENLIGNFLNIIPLRNNLSDNPDFISLLQRTQKITLEALKNRDLPFEKTVEHLKVKRDLSRNPLFQVMLQVLPKYSFELLNLQIHPFNFDLGYSQFDLSLHLYQVEDGYSCRIEYDTDLFESITIKRMVSNFEKLINEIITDPLKNINDYSVVSENEIRLLNNWNETETLFSQDKCFSKLFEEQVERRSNEIAVIYSDEYITYAELNSRANKLANCLIKKGIKKGAVVGICTDRSINMLVGLIAILKIGAAYIPLDPSFPRERLNFIMKDSDIKVLLTENKLFELISSFQIDSIYIDSEWEIINQEEYKNLELELNASDLMYVIYTSGSTGNPKGVMIEYRAVNNFLESMKMNPGFGENDNLLAITTMSFDISGLEFYLPLISGGCLVIADKSDTVDGKALLKLISKHNITVMQATPSTWKIMIESGWKRTPNLKMLCGGEAFSKDLASKILERGDELWNMYGPTETTIWSSVNKINKYDSKILIGRPIANTKFYVVDKALNRVPIGVAGELLIGGKGLARGYLNNEELTQKNFIQVLGISEEYLYRTGDLVKYHLDGNIEFLGRSDFQVKVRGFRIELAEIEMRLLEHKNIKEAVVIVNEKQSDEKKLVAYIIRKDKNGLELNSLLYFLKEKVPDYMIPSFFIELNNLPLTPNGKIDRKVLPEPDENIIIKDRTDNINQTDFEEELAGVWEEILEIGHISNSDNFFAIGGSSLSAIRLIYKLNEKFNIDLPLSVIFQAPTISKLSYEIGKVKQLICFLIWGVMFYL